MDPLHKHGEVVPHRLVALALSWVRRRRHLATSTRRRAPAVVVAPAVAVVAPAVAVVAPAVAIVAPAVVIAAAVAIAAAIIPTFASVAILPPVAAAVSIATLAAVAIVAAVAARIRSAILPARVALVGAGVGGRGLGGGLSGGSAFAIRTRRLDLLIHSLVEQTLNVDVCHRKAAC